MPNPIRRLQASHLDPHPHWKKRRERALDKQTVDLISSPRGGTTPRLGYTTLGSTDCRSDPCGILKKLFQQDLSILQDFVPDSCVDSSRRISRPPQIRPPPWITECRWRLPPLPDLPVPFRGVRTAHGPKSNFI